MTRLDRSSKAPTITVDTSCVISLLGRDNTPKDELRALRQIQAWDEAGQVQIWISEKSRTEAQQNLKKALAKGEGGFEGILKWVATLSSLNPYPVAESRAILDVSALGVDTYLGDDFEAQDLKEVEQVVFSEPVKDRSLGDVFDVSILFEHYLQQNDLFVTRDARRMLKTKVQAELQTRWGIKVLGPIEAVTALQSEYSVR